MYDGTDSFERTVVKPDLKEIEERMERESVAAKQQFVEATEAKNNKKANILKRVNCQIKNLEEPPKTPEKEDKWSRKEPAGTFGFELEKENQEVKEDEFVMPKKAIPARSKWGAQKETLVKKLDDLTLQQVILDEEGNSLSPSVKTRVISGSDSEKSAKNETDPLEIIDLTPKTSGGTPVMGSPVKPQTPMKSPLHKSRQFWLKSSIFLCF